MAVPCELALPEPALTALATVIVERLYPISVNYPYFESTPKSCRDVAGNVSTQQSTVNLHHQVVKFFHRDCLGAFLR